MKPRMTLFRLTALVLLLIVGSGLMAAGEVLARERIVYRLKWLINASTAGDVFALSQGFFSREGLEVTVKAGGPERDAIRELELGYAQFGVASADQVIRALAKGASVVVLAQLFQVNPLQMIQPDPDVPVGHIDTAAWQQTEQIMIRQKLIPGPVNVIDRIKPQQRP